jgi:glycosyltransferase involved in cell wall biosynthesis
MRVLIVTNTYPPADITGVGALVYELAQELDAEGHGALVLTRTAAPDDHLAVPTGGRKLLFPLLAGWRYLGLARQREFDLVHVHESDGVLVALALRLARLLGLRAGRARLMATLQVSYRRERLVVRPVRANGRVVSRPTGSERIFAWIRAPLLSFLGRLTARLSDAVVAPSAVTAGELEEDYGARVMAVIPNGVAELPEGDLKKGGTFLKKGGTFEKAPENGDLKKGGTFEEAGGPVVLYAGRLRTRKAVAVLVEAFAKLLETVPARLVVAGDGEHRQALEARVDDLGIGSSVRFLGAVPRPEMLRWYGTADIFCLPSLYEGFPLAILEAMAAGLPVVSTTVSGIPEAVEHGVTGLLVPPEDAAGLASALERLVEDADLRRTMGEAGRRRVAEEFAISKICADYLESWRSLLTPSQQTR